MDLSDSIIPKSDQMDYSDFIAGPRTVTITEVRPGASSEQPVEILLAEFDRPWRPAKSMRRVLVAAWGSDSNNYLGRRMTLFGDPSVKWGGIAIGGIRISHVSHITKPLTIALTESKGKRKPFSVEPVREAAPQTPAPARDWLAEAGKLSDVAALRALWSEAKAGGADPSTLAKIQALATPAATPAPDES
jgi:hypothetical protein